MSNVLCLLIFTPPLFAQYPVCGFQWLLDRQVGLDTSVLHRLSKADKAIGEAIRDGEGQISHRNEAVIPVVVHVVWNRREENLSDQAILFQIDILNRDFNSENEDMESVPNEFRPLLPQKGIRFCLAADDPQGLPTSGIARIQTDVEEIGIKEDLYAAAPAWDTEKYLNVWVAHTGEHITGFGTYPGQVDGLRQGVVVHPRYFGKNGSRRYGLGRVLVHEVGHFLGLQHTWDGNSGCDTNDGVEDTPLQAHPYLGCPEHPQASCGSNDLFMNFMDYVDDGCMVMFTQGQMERMVATLETLRPGLTDQTVSCIKNPEIGNNSAFAIYPNPTTGHFTLDFEKPLAETGGFEVYNSIGQLVYRYSGILRDKMQVDLTGLESGVYLIRVGRKVSMLVINNSG